MTAFKINEAPVVETKMSRKKEALSSSTIADGERVNVTITYLEQNERPTLAPPPRPPFKLALLRVAAPPVHYYRYLYRLVGDPVRWVSRRRIDDKALAEIIHDEGVHIYVLYVNGAPGGFAEIDARDGGECNIRFFGLAPDFTGRGLSRYFLANIVDIAWSLGPSRVCLETCTLDHPAALPLYQKMGFHVVDRKQGVVELMERPVTPR